jgi:hypothetical protein
MFRISFSLPLSLSVFLLPSQPIGGRGGIRIHQSIWSCRRCVLEFDNPDAITFVSVLPESSAWC